MDKQIIINFNNGSVCIRSFDNNIKISQISDKLMIKNSYLTYNGKILNEDKTLSDYKIDNNDILFENKRINGGIFSIIVQALGSILKFVELLMDSVDNFVMLFVKIFEIIPLLFQPKKFIDDIIFSVTYSIKKIVNGVIDSIDIGTSSNKEEEPDKIPKVCMPPSLFKLIILIICPPLALMINNGGGIAGFFLVVVCAILTVWCYYFPGLIFAALHILC